jgi:AcrR family transcriptional regulator
MIFDDECINFRHKKQNSATMKSKSKRDIFLEESLKLFYEKGFKATTMRDIASRLGFEVANVYNYIDSKQSLLQEIIFNLAEEFDKGIHNIINSSYNPKEKLKAIVSLHINLTAHYPYEISLLANDWRNLDEPDHGDFVKRRQDYVKKVSLIISEGVDSQVFRNMDVKIGTNALLASLRSLYTWYIDNKGDFNPVELEKQVSDFILFGILEEPKS